MSVRIFLLLGLVAAIRAFAAEPPIVVVLAGQSNMVGQGARAELPAAQRELPANVEVIEEGLEGPRVAPKSFGPELALAHALAAAHPERKFRFLKFAIGTTSIRAWSPEWSEAEARVAENVAFGAIYPRWLAFLRRHLRESDPPPHAILWFQGERDARFAAAAADYAPRLDSFIARLRADLHAPESWFILGLVNPPYPDAPIVAAAQRATPERVPRAKIVESAGLTKRSDALHYDTAGQWELGRRFAAALLPTLTVSAGEESSSARR